MSGLSLNGHTYQRGTHVEFLPYVRPRGNLGGVGGLLGSSESHRIGTILMLYTFTVHRHGKLYDTATFVEVADRPVLEKIRSLYNINSVAAEHLPAAGGAYSGDNYLIHVDAITAKVRLVPHFLPRLAATHMLAITMWEAR